MVVLSWLGCVNLVNLSVESVFYFDPGEGKGEVEE
jgi:hypothetical protein